MNTYDGIERNGTLWHFRFDASGFTQGFHYEMCIKKNSTLRIGH